MEEKRQENVIIERRYLPMKELFIDHQIMENVASILGEDTIDIRRYLDSPRSFEQYFVLSEEGEVSEKSKNTIMEILTAADQTNPILLRDFYPFLREEEWVIHSNQISHFTSYIIVEEEYVAITEIQKRRVGNTGGVELRFIQRDSNQSYCYPVQNECEVEQLMKSMLLYGEVKLQKK